MSGESSSSQTLWATASKEWVILPKPKPGRKPKKDSASQLSEGDTASRRTQNRAAQRAFRERKQSQLAELQARINSYEQGDIERSVALQKVAKRLKDENQLLREENGVLKTRVAELQARVEMNAKVMPNQADDPLATDKKRSRNPSPPTNPHTPLPHVSKRPRDAMDYPRNDPFSTDTCASDSINTFSPLQFAPRPEACSTDFSTSGNGPSNPRHDEPDTMPSFLNCGFCATGTLCVCREIACATPMEQAMDSVKFNSSAEESTLVASAASNVRDLPETSSNKRNEPMIFDNLPIYEPAVPIRRRNKGVPSNSIFPVHEAPPSENTSAICSGDPNNCLACAGDSFGQAFCAAIGSSSMNCDCSAEMMTGCCGSSSRCLNCPYTPSSLERSIPPEPAEMMPTNDAWQKLKAHPNVHFADLTLLAEVVARKSKCGGPQLVVSSQSDDPQTDHRTDADIADIQQGGSPPPRLVPHEVLLECGRKRMRQVRTAGVREALRLLDAKFP